MLSCIHWDSKAEILEGVGFSRMQMSNRLLLPLHGPAQSTKAIYLTREAAHIYMHARGACEEQHAAQMAPISSE